VHFYSPPVITWMGHAQYIHAHTDTNDSRSLIHAYLESKGADRSLIWIVFRTLPSRRPRGPTTRRLTTSYAIIP